MATLLPNGKQYYTTNEGLPLVGGKLYTYEAGTLVPKLTYKDADATVPNTNPIILDARGEAVVFWYGVYKIELRDSVDNVIWTIDDVTSADVAADELRDELANTTNPTRGDALVGVKQPFVGAVPQTQHAKNAQTRTPEDFGAIGDGASHPLSTVTNVGGINTAGWSLAQWQTLFPHAAALTDEIDWCGLQGVVDSFPNAANGAVQCGAGKSYQINKTFFIFNRHIDFDGNNAIITLNANATYVMHVECDNTEVHNIGISRTSESVVVTAAVYCKGLQQVWRNISSKGNMWPVFFWCDTLLESHFQNLRIDHGYIEPPNIIHKTGDIFHIESSFNNTISHSMLGYCTRGIFGASVGSNEGWLITGNIITLANRAIDFDRGTFISVVNNVLDFCEAIGCFFSNGHSNNVSNNWIASNTTDGFIGVGTLAVVNATSVMNNKIVRGAAAIANTRAVNILGANSVVAGNIMLGGMNGGFIQDGSSNYYGNRIESPGTDFTAPGPLRNFQVGGTASGAKGEFGLKFLPEVGAWEDSGDTMYAATGTFNVFQSFAGSIHHVVNVSGAAINMNQFGAVTMKSALGNGTRTLAPSGVAMLWWRTGTEVYVFGGPGLS